LADAKKDRRKRIDLYLFEWFLFFQLL